MAVIIRDTKTGREYKIVGHELDYEIYKKVEPAYVDANGQAMTKNGKVFKNEWVFTGYYPTTFPHAVYMCMHFLLAGENSEEECVEAEKARIQLGKYINKRLNELVAEVEDDK